MKKKVTLWLSRDFDGERKISDFKPENREGVYTSKHGNANLPFIKEDRHIHELIDIKIGTVKLGGLAKITVERMY
jgi:hypothetical protein